MKEKTAEELVDIIEKIERAIKELKEKEQEYKEILFSIVKKSEDGKPIYIAEKARIIWREDAKISQKEARMWLEKNPELSKRIFTLTIKPKKSAISQLERTLISNPDKVPNWVQDLAKVKESITFEEKQILEILKDKEAEEND